jgi:hypothetical protein
MLGLRDNVTLATTKLRVRRLRLAITLIVAGILFTVLVFGSLVIRGSLSSLNSFFNEGFLSSFLVTVSPVPDYQITQTSKFIARVEAIDKLRLDQQAAEAKRLGLPFDPKTAPHAVTEDLGPDGTKHKTANTSYPSAQQAFLELSPNTLPARLKAAATPYHPKTSYEAFNFAPLSYSSVTDFAPIINGKEVTTNRSGGGFGPQDALKSFSTSLTAFDNGLLKPFMLDNTTLDTATDSRIPIMAPIDGVETLLGLKPLSGKAKPVERIDRLRLVREKAKNLTLDVCFRNSTAISQLAQATQQATEITAHAGDADYQKPAVIYGLPTTPCQPPTVTSDSRSAADKALAAKQTQFDETFGAPKPVTQRLSLRIVGVLPQIGAFQTATGPEALISSFFTTSLGQGWFASRPAMLANPALAAVMNDPYTQDQGSQQLFVDFANRTAEKSFLDKFACDYTSGISPQDCAGSGKFYILPFGNPLATLYDMKKGFDDTLKIVLLIIGVLSATVMAGTIGKIIADSRKETSVFRAVGAKRLDIAQIYLLYTLILASLSFLIAGTIGLAGALYVNATYSPALSAQAVLAFNSHNLGKTFTLIGLNPLDFLKIYGFVLAVSLISASVPLSSNLSRNPVKDMREE